MAEAQSIAKGISRADRVNIFVANNLPLLWTALTVTLLAISGACFLAGPSWAIMGMVAAVGAGFAAFEGSLARINAPFPEMNAATHTTGKALAEGIEAGSKAKGQGQEQDHTHNHAIADNAAMPGAGAEYTQNQRAEGSWVDSTATSLNREHGLG